MADPISGPRFPWPEKYWENRDKFPPEELWKYAGQHVAWSWDGTRIVASAPTLEELYKRLDELGVDSERVIGDYVYDPNITSVVGGL